MHLKNLRFLHKVKMYFSFHFAWGTVCITSAHDLSDIRFSLLEICVFSFFLFSFLSTLFVRLCLFVCLFVYSFVLLFSQVVYLFPVFLLHVFSTKIGTSHAWNYAGHSRLPLAPRDPPEPELTFEQLSLMRKLILAFQEFVNPNLTHDDSSSDLASQASSQGHSANPFPKFCWVIHFLQVGLCEVWNMNVGNRWLRLLMSTRMTWDSL